MADDIDPIFYKNLPRKYMAAGALFMNIKKEIMLVKPIYKDVWDIPGGIVNENESPRSACEREVHEELGVQLKPDRLLVMDFSSLFGDKGDSLHFIFLGGLVGDKLTEHIQLNLNEVSEYQFVEMQEARHMVSRPLAKRLLKAFDALEHDRTLVLENGEYT